jgi:hypothetical protein
MNLELVKDSAFAEAAADKSAAQEATARQMGGFIAAQGFVFEACLKERMR